MCNIFPHGESFSDLLSDLFAESAERISGSTEFSLKARNRSFVCCCFFQHWHDGDDAHNEAEIEKYQQPPCKLNLLLINRYKRFVLIKEIGFVGSLRKMLVKIPDVSPSNVPLKPKSHNLKRKKQSCRASEILFLKNKSRNWYFVSFAAFLGRPDGRLQQRAVQQLLRRPPTRTPPAG